MSSCNLTNDQVNLLKLGLKFCPTPQSNIPELQKDLKEFERKFRLKEMFFNEPYNDPSLVKNQSNFQPPKKRDKYLDQYFENLFNENLEENKNTPTNLSFRQKSALTELKNNQNIVIKEADKGSAVVVLDKDFYKEKILEMINDREFYEELTDNKDKSIISKFQNFAICIIIF